MCRPPFCPLESVLILDIMLHPYTSPPPPPLLLPPPLILSLILQAFHTDLAPLFIAAVNSQYVERVQSECKAVVH